MTDLTVATLKCLKEIVSYLFNLADPLIQETTPELIQDSFALTSGNSNMIK